MVFAQYRGTKKKKRKGEMRARVGARTWLEVAWVDCVSGREGRGFKEMEGMSDVGKHWSCVPGSH